MLVGIEFAGHHGVSLAHDLHGRGCHVVSVLAKSAKQARDGSLSGRNKTDRIDAKYICVTLGRGTCLADVAETAVFSRLIGLPR